MTVFSTTLHKTMRTCDVYSKLFNSQIVSHATYALYNMLRYTE